MPSFLKAAPVDGLEKLRKAARNYPCTLCGNIGTTVACHSNALHHGRGASFKAPGYMVAYLCQTHHDLIDGRLGGLSRDEKRRMWDEAYANTVQIWFRDGLIRVV